MLRNGLVIVLALAMSLGTMLSPASAANTARANTMAAMAARQAALAQAAKKKHKHHHHKKTSAAGQILPAVK